MQKASSQVCPWQHVTHLRYAPQELCLLHQWEFGVNTKLILQKHTSGCQNTKATAATVKDVTPTPVESKTNVLCESTADGKNPHSLKSNEMAECSSVKPGEGSRILAYAHGSSPYTGKVSVWRCIINDWTRLDQVTMLS